VGAGLYVYPVEESCHHCCLQDSQLTPVEGEVGVQMGKKSKKKRKGRRMGDRIKIRSVVSAAFQSGEEVFGMMFRKDVGWKTQKWKRRAMLQVHKPVHPCKVLRNGPSISDKDG
jgi:hypothetical protein